MTVKVPVQGTRPASSSIGPIWNDGDCASEHSQASPLSWEDSESRVPRAPTAGQRSHPATVPH